VHDRVTQAKRAIIDNPVFFNIMDACALDIHAGDDANTVGQIQPFNSQEFERAMKATGNYTCGFNLMGVDPHFSATPGIPLKPAAIDHLVQHYFSQPDFVPVIVQIAIPKGADPAALGKSGQLKSFTPEEMRMAIYLAIKRDIDNKDDDELHWRAVNQRENIAHDFASMRRSSLQRLYEVIMFKGKHEANAGATLTVEKMAELYKEKVKMAESSESVSTTFITQAIRVHKSVLAHPDLRKFLLECDDRDGAKNPFDSVAKIEAINQKIKGVSDMKWVFHSLYDSWKCGYLGGSISERALKGQSPGMNGKGIAELALFRKQAKDILLEKLSPYCNPDAFQKLSEVLAAHESYRNQRGFPSSRLDGTRRATWKDSAIKSFRLLEETVYGTECDQYMKRSIVFRKSASSMIEEAPFPEEFEEIEALWKQETGQAISDKKDDEDQEPEMDLGAVKHTTTAEEINIVSHTNATISINIMDESTSAKIAKHKRDIFERVRTLVQLQRT
ncbi:unnamed protein product, partial [Prorocentrum cordatum]